MRLAWVSVLAGAAAAVVLVSLYAGLLGSWAVLIIWLNKPRRTGRG